MIRSGELVYWVHPVTGEKTLALVVKNQYEYQYHRGPYIEIMIAVDVLHEDEIYRNVPITLIEKIKY